MKAYPLGNFKIFILFSLVFMAFSGFSDIVASLENDFNRLQYKILPTSLFEVNGTTNINSFSCLSDERFEQKYLDYKLKEDEKILHFKNTKFKIQIDQLDCGNKKMNKDLFKALRAEEFPNITIQLKEAINLECRDLTNCGEWQQFDIISDITITCETEPMVIPIMVKKLDEASYRIVGGTSLKLCDFNIEAPTALMGLIKVKDVIDFNFDLFVDSDIEEWKASN